MSSARSSQRQKPAFLWQGLLLLLPMAVLSAIGLYALRQDRNLAEREAREHAEMIAHDLVARIADELGEPPKVFGSTTGELHGDYFGVPGGRSVVLPLQKFPREPSVLIQTIDSNEQQSAFLVDDNGRLIFPVSYSPALVPKPFDLSQLNGEQRRLWQLGETGYLAEGKHDAATAALEDFLATSPPDDFAAAAHYSLGLLAHKGGEHQKASGILGKVQAAYPAAVLESGLRLQPLVQMKLIEISILASSNVVTLEGWPPWSPDLLYSNLVFHPTALTPHFLKMLADFWRTRGFPQTFGETWHKTWENHEQARRLHQAMSQFWHADRGETSRKESRNSQSQEAHFSLTERSDIPPHLWVNAGENWLAARVESGGTNHVIFFRSEENVRQIVQSVQSQANKIPNYFAIGIDVAGRSIQAPTNTAATLAVSSGSLTALHQRPLPMKKDPATISARRDGLKVSVHLINPDLLYARQRQRSLWFGSLLAISSLTAVAGFVTARRAFYRQIRLNELKSNFVSSVSHELRTPIASVRLMAEGLESGRIKDDRKKQDYFKFIVQECRRLTSLIENVLDFSRIEQGRKDYEFEPTDLVALVQQTVKTMGTYAAERGVALALTMNDAQLATPNSQPLLDGRAIQQALVNLIDNAIKHSPKTGTVTIGVDLPSAAPRNLSRITHLSSIASATEDHASRLSLWVEDNGPGIPPDEHDRIFERFYRVGSELRRETQGVGIGLSIVKHIVDAHGGRVTVRSAVGKGSRFTMELPVNGPGK